LPSLLLVLFFDSLTGSLGTNKSLLTRSQRQAAGLSPLQIKSRNKTFFNNQSKPPFTQLPSRWVQPVKSFDSHLNWLCLEKSNE
jgi:hypothetical protein